MVLRAQGPPAEAVDERSAPAGLPAFGDDPSIKSPGSGDGLSPFRWGSWMRCERSARAGRDRVPAATCESWELLMKLTGHDADVELDGHHAKPPLMSLRPGVFRPRGRDPWADMDRSPVAELMASVAAAVTRRAAGRGIRAPASAAGHAADRAAACLPGRARVLLRLAAAGTGPARRGRPDDHRRHAGHRRDRGWVHRPGLGKEGHGLHARKRELAAEPERRAGRG
jgi:hypothetical protein